MSNLMLSSFRSFIAFLVERLFPRKSTIKEIYFTYRQTR